MAKSVRSASDTTSSGISTRRALVTGAAGNFGARVAASLASHGAHVIAADRPGTAAKLAEVVAECSVAGQPQAVAVEFDVTNTDEVSETIAEIGVKHGPLELLVNNAGYQGEFASILDYPIADATKVMDTNVIGAFAVLQAAAKQMAAAGGGAVVNVASMAGVSGAANMPAYSASKAAIAGLTRAAAKDLAAYNIRVNAVSPGFIGPGPMWERQVDEQARVDSAFYGDTPDEVARQMIGSVPLGRYGSVDEVADTIVFLLGDAAGFITGIDVEISGGGR